MATRERIRPRREDVRTGVLAAAREVFAESGYHRASLEAIARRAGFSKGAVYSNFESKDDLFLALLEPEADQMAALLTDIIEPTGDLDADLGTLAGAIEALTVSSPATLLFAEFRAHAARDPELAARLAEIRVSMITHVGDRLVTELARMGAELVVPPADAATLLLALINGLTLEHVGIDGQSVAIASLVQLLRGLVTPSA